MMILIWLSIIIVATIIEIITVDLVSIWFAIGGVGAAIATLLHLSTSIQITFFIVLSFICIILTSPLAKKYLRTNIVHTNYDRVIGHHGVVTKRMDMDSKGEVKVMSTLWMACSCNGETLEMGDYCEVLAVEGAHLIVKKINKGES